MCSSTSSTASGIKSNKAAPRIVPAENAIKKFKILCNPLSDKLRVKTPIKESMLINKVATIVFKVLGSIIQNLIQD